MEQTELNKYKNKLSDEKVAVEEEIRRNEKPVDFGSDVDHLEEKTDESEEVGNQTAVADDLKKRLSEINIALEKMKNGNYGICEQCGKNIEKEILDIDPESKFCKNCKLKK